MLPLDEQRRRLTPESLRLVFEGGPFEEGAGGLLVVEQRLDLLPQRLVAAAGLDRETPARSPGSRSSASW